MPRDLKVCWPDQRTWAGPDAVVKTNTSGRKRDGLRFSLAARHFGRFCIYRLISCLFLTAPPSSDFSHVSRAVVAPPNTHTTHTHTHTHTHTLTHHPFLLPPLSVLYSSCQRSLCPQASAMSYLFGPAGIPCPHNFVCTWWMMAEIYRCQIFLVFISARHTHPGLFGTGDCIFHALWIALRFQGEDFFFFFFFYFLLWSGVILPFYGVYIIASLVLFLSPQLERLPSQQCGDQEQHSVLQGARDLRPRRHVRLRRHQRHRDSHWHCGRQHHG